MPFISVGLNAQPVPAITSKACPATHYDETVMVRSVHDGDTVRLKDGRKVRLIGINTPELERDNKPAQAFAREARDRLKLQIKKHDNTVKLVYGKERQDRYKRILAHLFLPDGSNLQADLLEQGLATAMTFSPNDHFSDCYHRVESVTRCKGSRIWSEKQYIAVNSVNLDNKTEGFRILTTNIQRINKSSKSINLFLKDGILAGIKQPDMRYFDNSWLESLINKPITIRGWLHPKKKAENDVKFFMRLRHPSAISLSGEANNAVNCSTTG